MPKIDCVCCLLFRYVNATEQTSYVRTYVSKARRNSSCVLGRNEKMEKGDARICYQSRGLPRSPTTSSTPSCRVSRPPRCRAYWLAEVLRRSLLSGSTKPRILQFAYSLSRILDTLASPVRCISRHPEFSRIFGKLHTSIEPLHRRILGLDYRFL